MTRPMLLSLFSLFVCGASFAQTPNPTLGRDLAANCANCHGTDGKSATEVPGLAGRPAAEITAAMADFKAGKRSATIMHQLAKGYSDAQVTAIADFLSKQK